MGHIVTLDHNMINMIAAGEVIERPANVVKELMENSIDAGASQVRVAIEDGGRKSIRISDNGYGMGPEDLSSAFEPHATSKIKNQKDLFGISTLGFRGEALASIASVAHVKAKSRTRDSLTGNCIEIDSGEKGPVTPCSTDVGTTIEVRDIFYKVPARRKFLRTANTEMGHISEQFTRLALANTAVDLALKHNNRQLYQLMPDQDMRQRIANLFSNDLADNLLYTQRSEKNIGISAFLGRPDISRSTGQYQYVFLNNRFIRDKFISHAIKEAYRGHLEPNRYPVAFVFITMPYEDYDVNVHPTKIEVRFYNANAIHAQVLSVLREKLLSTNMDIIATVPTSQSPSKPDTKIAEAMADFFKKYKPDSHQRQFTLSPAATAHHISATKKYEIVETQKSTHFFQVHDSYIIQETDEGLEIIDQHALHERILFQNLKTRISKGPLESQRLLIPQSFEISETKNGIIDAHRSLLEKLGIEIVSFGPRTAAIQSFPMLLSKANPVELMEDIIDLLLEKKGTSDTDSLIDEVLEMAACKAAVKAGQKLTDSEIEQLLLDKKQTDYSSRCPHGRPTTIKFTLNELEKQFKRT